MQRVPLDVSRTKLARTKMKRFRFLQRSSPLYSGRMQVKRNRDVKPQSNTSICINYCCSGSSVIVAQVHRLAFKVVVHTTRCPTDPFNQIVRLFTVVLNVRQMHLKVPVGSLFDGVDSPVGIDKRILAVVGEHDHPV